MHQHHSLCCVVGGEYPVFMNSAGTMVDMYIINLKVQIEKVTLFINRERDAFPFDTTGHHNLAAYFNLKRVECPFEIVISPSEEETSRLTFTSSKTDRMKCLWCVFFSLALLSM